MSGQQKSTNIQIGAELNYKFQCELEWSQQWRYGGNADNEKNRTNHEKFNLHFIITP